MTPTLADLDWPVRTERLLLRPATMGDADAAFGYRSLEPVARWMTALPDDARAFAEEWVLRLPRQLMIERDGAPIGDLYLHVQDAWSQAEVRDEAAMTQAEIGYVLDPAHVGHGCATEAVRALLSVAFEGLGVRRVTAQCFADNEGSWRLMERVGMRRETHAVRESLHRDGRWLDGLGYAILAEEWLSGG